MGTLALLRLGTATHFPVKVPEFAGRREQSVIKLRRLAAMGWHPCWQPWQGHEEESVVRCGAIGKVAPARGLRLVAVR